MTKPIPRAMGRTTLPAPPPPGADAFAFVGAALDKVAANPAMQARHSAANAAVGQSDLVMIDDSLTEIGRLATPAFFGRAIVNRGISGQTSPQILRRVMADVVDLAPKRVHIMCGTNDITGNTGPTLPQDYQRNIRAMVDLAADNGIDMLLASIPPAGGTSWLRDRTATASYRL